MGDRVEACVKPPRNQTKPVLLLPLIENNTTRKKKVDLAGLCLEYCHDRQRANRA